MILYLEKSQTQGGHYVRTMLMRLYLVIFGRVFVP